jgi:hypothetical protein
LTGTDICISGNKNSPSFAIPHEKRQLKLTSIPKNLVGKTLDVDHLNSVSFLNPDYSTISIGAKRVSIPKQKRFPTSVSSI